MSRLDYFTIAIVAVCILAIVFLLYKTTDIFGKKDKPAEENIETPVDSSEEPESTLDEDPYYNSDTDTSLVEGSFEDDNIVVDEDEMDDSAADSGKEEEEEGRLDENIGRTTGGGK